MTRAVALRVAWAVASESAFAVVGLLGPWPVTVACAIGWAMLSNARAYQEARAQTASGSKRQPKTILATTAAAVIAAVVAVRSSAGAAVLFLTYLPIAGSSGFWRQYATEHQHALAARDRATAIEFLRRQTALGDDASELARLEHELRRRLHVALETARRFGDDSARSSTVVVASLEALRAALRSVREIWGEIAEMPPSSERGPAEPTSLFAQWAHDVRAYHQAHSAKSVQGKVSSAAAWLVMAAVGAWIPGVRSSIELVPWVTLVFGVGGAPLMALLERFALQRRGDGAHFVAASSSVALMQITCASLVACAGPAGAVAYVAQYSAAVIGHAAHFRFSLRTPWALGCLLAGLLVGCIVARGETQRVVLLTTFALSLPMALYAGTRARELDDVIRSTDVARRNWEADQEDEARARIRVHADALRELFGGAHDATSPLLAASLVARQVEEGTDDAADAEPRLNGHVANIQRILEATLASGAPAAPPVVVVDLARVLESTLAHVSPRVSLETDLQSASASVRGGDESVRRMAANLVDNALEASRTRIRVRTTETADAVLLVVEDDGPGFPDDYRVRAFATKKADGVGLGLFVVDRLAVLSSGSLELGRSTELGGACVTIRLPRSG